MAEKKIETKAEASKPWLEMKSITLPRAGKNEEKSVYVSINGKGFQVPKGKATNVPAPVYERLMIMQAAADMADRYAEGLEGNHKLG